MITGISAADFEVQFLDILGRVKSGELFTITVDGVPTAEIVPATPKRSQEEVAAAVEGLLNFPRLRGISGDTVREWISEGRR